jgi:hypothetical protein
MMRTHPHVAIATLFALAALLSASACSRQPTSLDLRSLAKPAAGPATPLDTIPIPPPPPSPTPILPIAFAGADSAYPGTTAHLRWAVGNESSAPFRVDYTMVCELPWAGLPISGSIEVPPLSTAPLSVAVNVPADATSGMVEFTMAVTRPDGISPTTAQGSLRVWSDQPPPPPPPPPIPPIIYVGADTANAGGTVNQTWTLSNESQEPFTMQWTLESLHHWAGYPQSGTISLAAGGWAHLFTAGSVPDTAGAGPRRTRLFVSRPSGLPPASADGEFLVLP